MDKTTNPNKLVVMIDDDQDDALLFQHMLTTLQSTIELIWYHSPESFMDTHSPTPKPQLILLDYSLPGHNGVEWLPTFLSHPCCQDVPVIMFTGSESDQHYEEAIEAGAAGYLIKPSSQQELKEVVETIVDTWLPA